MELAELETQLNTLDTYLSADIWIVDKNGTILLDSSDESSINDARSIDSFDISDFGNQYYGIGTFMTALRKRN